MSSKETVKWAAVGWGVTAVAALHPALWRRLVRSERRALERPWWKTVARAMVASALALAIKEYSDRNIDRWKTEHPELFEGLPDPRGH